MLVKYVLVETIQNMVIYIIYILYIYYSLFIKIYHLWIFIIFLDKYMSLSMYFMGLVENGSNNLKIIYGLYYIINK